MTKDNRHRSAVTNGTRTHIREIGQAEYARRFRDLLSMAEDERGGRAAMTVSAQEAARAWAGLALALELMHADLAAGHPVDAEAMGQLGDRMDRQSRRMGPVKAVPVKPSLRERHGAAQGGRAR